MNEQLIRHIIINDLHFSVCRLLRKLILNVFSKTSATISSKDIQIVIIKMVMEGELIQLDIKSPTSSEVESIYFLKGTQFLNLEEVIANQQSLKRSSRLGEESTGD